MRERPAVWIRLASLAYRLCARLAPHRFRERFGPESEDTFQYLVRTPSSIADRGRPHDSGSGMRMWRASVWSSVRRGGMVSCWWERRATYPVDSRLRTRACSGSGPYVDTRADRWPSRWHLQFALPRGACPIAVPRRRSSGRRQCPDTPRAHTLPPGCKRRGLSECGGVFDGRRHVSGCQFCCDRWRTSAREQRSSHRWPSLGPGRVVCRGQGPHAWRARSS
jgi:hypothetical protein